MADGIGLTSSLTDGYLLTISCNKRALVNAEPPVLYFVLAVSDVSAQIYLRLHVRYAELKMGQWVMGQMGQQIWMGHL